MKLYASLRDTMWYFVGLLNILQPYSYMPACSGTMSLNEPVSSADRTFAIVFSSIAA